MKTTTKKRSQTVTTVAARIAGEDIAIMTIACIEPVLAAFPTPARFIVVDRYMWLDDQNDPGLGKFLFDALNQTSRPTQSRGTDVMPAVLRRLALRGSSVFEFFCKA